RKCTASRETSAATLPRILRESAQGKRAPSRGGDAEKRRKGRGPVRPAGALSADTSSSPSAGRRKEWRRHGSVPRAASRAKAAWTALPTRRVHSSALYRDHTSSL